MCAECAEWCSWSIRVFNIDLTTGGLAHRALEVDKSCDDIFFRKYCSYSIEDWIWQLVLKASLSRGYIEQSMLDTRRHRRGPMFSRETLERWWRFTALPCHNRTIQILGTIDGVLSVVQNASLHERVPCERVTFRIPVSYTFDGVIGLITTCTVLGPWPGNVYVHVRIYNGIPTRRYC